MDPKEYIDEVFKPDMLPIDRDYALSLVETFLIHHVISLATEADEQILISSSIPKNGLKIVLGSRQ